MESDGTRDIELGLLYNKTITLTSCLLLAWDWLAMLARSQNMRRYSAKRGTDKPHVASYIIVLYFSFSLLRRVVFSVLMVLTDVLPIFVNGRDIWQKLEFLLRDRLVVLIETISSSRPVSACVTR